MLVKEIAHFQSTLQSMIEALRHVTIPNTDVEYAAALDKHRELKIHELSEWLGMRYSVSSPDDEWDSSSENDGLDDLLKQLDEIDEVHGV